MLAIASKARNMSCTVTADMKSPTQTSACVLRVMCVCACVCVCVIEEIFAAHRQHEKKKYAKQDNILRGYAIGSNRPRAFGLAAGGYAITLI